MSRRNPRSKPRSSDVSAESSPSRRRQGLLTLAAFLLTAWLAALLTMALAA